MLTNTLTQVVGLNRCARQGRMDPAGARARKVHVATTPTFTIRTSNVRHHVAIAHSRSVQQCDLSCGVVLRLVVTGPQARRDCDVAAICGLVHHEHIATAHARALAQCNPFVASWRRNLEEDVPGARCARRNVKTVADITLALLVGLRICSRA